MKKWAQERKCWSKFSMTLVLKWKRRNLLRWLQIDNRPNTCKPNDSSRVQMKQTIWTQGKWSFPHYHRKWKGFFHQTTSEMEHRKSKLDAISDKKKNYNKSAGPEHNRRSSQLPSQNHNTSSRENHSQNIPKDEKRYQ